MFKNLLGLRTVRVIKGTIDPGDYLFEHGMLTRDGVVVVDFHNDLDTVHRLNTESAKNAVIAGGISAAFCLLLGPFGLLSLLTSIGDRNNVTFKVTIAPSEEDKDGETFMAVADSKVFLDILSYSVEG